MKELEFDKYGNIVFKEAQEIMPLNDFLERIGNPNNQNSIAPFSKNTYLVNVDNEEYCLSSVNSKAKRKLNKLCKAIGKRENLKKSLHLNYINSSNIGHLIKDAKTSLVSSNKLVLEDILSSLGAVGITLYGIGGTPLLLYLTLSGVVDSWPAIFVALAALGLAPSFVIGVIGFSLCIEGGISFKDITNRFKKVFESCKERKLNVSNLRELKALSKKLDISQLESPKEKIINIEDEIETIMNESNKLDTVDRRIILEDVKRIIEQYKVNDEKNKKMYSKSFEAQEKLVQELRTLESNISLLIRRKNLEQAIKNYSNHEEIVIEREEEGPVRRLTPQN